jgi:CubicO group peptidase (beta-lactamase class C family)
LTKLDINLPLTHKLLLEGVEQGLHPGAQIYVSLKGEVVADDGIGEARPEVPMNRDTINLWMSATKPITAVLFAQSWESGKLELDITVCEVIPEFASGGKSGITFRHLLTHTGGFRPEPDGLVGSKWAKAVSSVCSVALEQDWQPGERAGYHPATSWYILAEAIARIEDTSFQELAKQKVFDPLVMENSWIGVPVHQQKKYGESLGWMFRANRFVRPDTALNREEAIADVRPGGNGRGPISELGRFYEVLLGGGGDLLRPDTVARLTTRQREGLYDHTFQHYLDWGFGFMVNSNRYGPITVPYSFGLHASEVTFGHGGSQSSAAFADPEHDLVVALVCNGMPGEPRHNKRARDLNTAIYEDLGLV